MIQLSETFKYLMTSMATDSRKQRYNFKGYDEDNGQNFKYGPEISDTDSKNPS